MLSRKDLKKWKCDNQSELDQFAKTIILITRIYHNSQMTNLLINNFADRFPQNPELATAIAVDVVAKTTGEKWIYGYGDYGYSDTGYFAGNSTDGYQMKFRIKDSSNTIYIGDVLASGTSKIYQKGSLTPTFNYKIYIGNPGTPGPITASVDFINQSTFLVLKNVSQSTIDDMKNLGYLLYNASTGYYTAQKDADIEGYIPT